MILVLSACSNSFRRLIPASPTTRITKLPPFRMSSFSSSEPQPAAASVGSSSITVQNMYTVIARIEQAAVNAGRDPNVPRLCAVSKTKPAIAVQELYEAGHRIFGENYVQELVEKSAQLPADISWHFIGSLQSNKVKPLLRDVPSLACVQTVDSAKLALKLNSAVEALARAPLDVYLQVDTSGEDTKSGIPPAELGELVQFVSANCPQLRLKGICSLPSLPSLSLYLSLSQRTSLA